MIIIKTQKEPFKTGMIFRSKTNPQFDLIIDYVTYLRSYKSSHDFNEFSIICWCNINKLEFDKFIEKVKGKNSTNTFPYPFAGECKISSMKQRLKKYNLEYAGMSDDEVIVYKDDEWEYSSGFKNLHSELSK